MNSLKSKRDLILLSLIIKGVLLYGAIASVVYLILAIDNMSSTSIAIYGLVLGFLAYFLKRTISKNDFKRITFLSREERREFDSETV